MEGADQVFAATCARATEVVVAAVMVVMVLQILSGTVRSNTPNCYKHTQADIHLCVDRSLDGRSHICQTREQKKNKAKVGLYSECTHCADLTASQCGPSSKEFIIISRWLGRSSRSIC